MNQKVSNIGCKFVAISAIFLVSTTWLKVSADLVPLKALLAGPPSYEYALQFEDRRHNLKLLEFREQKRAVEATVTKAMIDCANTPPEDNCAKKAATEEMRAIKVVSKKEIDENTLHLNNLDKLATFYAFGKH